MRLSNSALLAVALAAALCLGRSSVAGAEAPSDSSAYDAALNEAIAAHREQRWLDAHVLFERAHALYPSARTLRGLGISAFEAGHYALALRDLEAALVHPERPLPDDLRQGVQEMVAHLKTLVGVYVFRLEPPGSTLRIDDREPITDSEGAVLLDPGLHRAVVSLNGHVSQMLELDVHRGDRSEMRVRLTVPAMPAALPAVSQPISGAEPPAPGPLLVPPADQPVRRFPLRTGALTVGGLGVLSFATAGALYGVARARVRDIARDCEGRRGNGCTDGEASALAQSHDLPRLEHGMTATLVVGAALTAAGVLLWVLDVRTKPGAVQRGAADLRVRF